MRCLRNTSLRKILATVMAVTLLHLGSVSSAAADVVSTEEILESSQVAEQRAELHAFTARADVRQKLLDYGVDEATIEERIASLTDGEVQQMHEQIDTLPAGQGILETVIAMLVIFILLDIAGVTDIFPGV